MDLFVRERKIFCIMFSIKKITSFAILLCMATYGFGEIRYLEGAASTIGAGMLSQIKNGDYWRINDGSTFTIDMMEARGKPLEFKKNISGEIFASYGTFIVNKEDNWYEPAEPIVCKITSVVSRNSAEIPSFSETEINGTLHVSVKGGISTFTNNKNVLINGKFITDDSARIKGSIVTVSEEAGKGSFVIKGGLDTRAQKDWNVKLVLNSAWAFCSAASTSTTGDITTTHYNDIRMMISNANGVFDLELGASQRIQNLEFQKNTAAISDFRVNFVNEDAVFIMKDITTSAASDRVLDGKTQQYITFSNFRNNRFFITANLASRLETNKIKVSYGTKFGYVSLRGVDSEGRTINAFKLEAGTTTGSNGETLSGWWLNTDGIVDRIVIQEDLPATTNSYLNFPTNISIKAKSTDGVALTYKWYEKKAGASEFVPMSQTGNPLVVTPTAAMNGNEYKCELSTPKYKATSAVTRLSLGTSMMLVTDLPPTSGNIVGESTTFSVDGASKVSGAEISYSWYEKKAGSSQFVKFGGNDKDLTFVTSSANNGSEFKCVISDGYNSVESSVLLFSAQEGIVITNNLVSSYDGYAGKKLTLAVTAKSNLESPVYSYEWFVRKAGEEEFKSTKFKKDTYILSVGSAMDGNEYKCVVSDGTNITESNVGKIVLRQAAKITAQPKKATLFSGGSTEFTVSAQGYNLTYQWQYYDKSLRDWVDISGANEATLSETQIPYSANGKQYRCVVANGGSNPVNSASVVTTVKQTAEFSQQPANVTVEIGENAKFSVKAVGAAPIKYQWQIWDTQTEQWSDIDRATSANYSLSRVSKDVSGQLYRCRIINGGLSDWLDSETVKLTVNMKSSVVTPETSCAVFENLSRDISVEAVAEAPINYKWQYMKDGAWTDAYEDTLDDGVSQAVINYTVNYSDITAPTRYQCLVWSGNGENAKVIKSKTINVTPCVLTAVDVNERTTILAAIDGADKSVSDANSKAKFAVTAKGYGALKYQWYESSDNGANWDEIEKAKSSIYTTPRLLAANGDFDKLFKCVVSNPAGTVESPIFKVTQMFAMRDSDIEKIENHTCSTADIYEFSVKTKYDGLGVKLTYQWLVDKNDGKGFVAAGSAKDTLKITRPKLALDKARYVCRVSNAANAKGEYGSSNAAVLTVKEAASITKAPATVTTITGNKAVFKVTASGYNMKYTWEIFDAKGNLITKAVTSVPEFEYIFDSEAKAARVVCTAQSYDDDGTTLLGPSISRQGSVSAMAEIQINAIVATEKGADGVEFKKTGLFEASYDFPFMLSIDMSGYSPKYQWYESINGGAFVELKNGRAKTYSPSVKEKDWVGVTKKSYYCKVSNSNRDGSSEASTPVIDITIGVAAAPADFSGRGFEFEAEGEGVLMLMFLNKSQCRISTDEMYGEVSFRSPTYTYKRINSKEALFTLKYTLINKEQSDKPFVKSYTGSMIFDKSGDFASLELYEPASGTTIQGILTCLTKESLAPVSLPLNTEYKILINKTQETTLTLINKTECMAGSDRWKYSYVKKGDAVGVLTIKGKDSEGAAVQDELTICFVDESFSTGVLNETYNLGGKISYYTVPFDMTLGE